MRNRVLFTSILLFVLLACLTVGTAQAETPAAGSDYVVRSGDWLARIADQAYGDPWLYPAIVRATHAAAGGDYATITDATRIEIGWKLRLPTLEEARQGLTLTALRNATYGGIYDQPVTLVDGRYQGEPFVKGGASRPTVILIEHALGDLDGDGADDAAVLLVENSGGSGSFVYLAVMLDRQDVATHVATVLLGDRVQVDAVAVREGVIVIDTLTHGPKDPMCCPSQVMTLAYGLMGGELVEVQSPDTLPGVTPANDPVGTTWQWTQFLGGNDSVVRVKDPSRYTLTLMADGNLALQVDCNRGRGTYTLDGASLSFGPIAATRAACPADSQDAAFLRYLEGVRTYVMDDGKLVLNLMADAGDMVFEPAKDEGLVDVVWQWERLLGGEGREIVVDDPARYTLELRADGTYAARADCNRAGGGFKREGESLSLLPGPMTLAECAEGSLYRQYIEYLMLSESFAVEDGNLVVQLQADGPSMVFVRAD